MHNAIYARDIFHDAITPDAILRLLDERDAMERERDKARQQCLDGTREVLRMKVAAEAERDALAADARRYRRLRECIIGVGIVGPAERVMYATRIPALHLPSPSPTNGEIDAAIDALDGAKG